jgi:hypothetical protein
MKMIKATALDRKSGGAQWRDLRFLSRFSHAERVKPECTRDKGYKYQGIFTTTMR